MLTRILTRSRSRSPQESTFCACLLSLPTKDTGTVPGLPPVSFYRWLACLPATSGRRRVESQPPRPHPDFRKRVHSTGRNTGVSLGFLVSFPRIQYSYRVRPFIGKVFISTPEDVHASQLLLRYCTADEQTSRLPTARGNALRPQ